MAYGLSALPLLKAYPTYLATGQEENGPSQPQELSYRPPVQGEAEEAVLLEEQLESPRHLTRLLLKDQAGLNHQEQQMLALIRQERAIEVTYGLTHQFVTMVRKRQGNQFDAWLESCLTSGIPDLETFALGLQREYAALTLPYSHGPVEGQITPRTEKWRV